MNVLSKWGAALAFMSGTVYGQVPSTNDTSDTHQNTGMGSVALNHTSTTIYGANNTAAGYATLYFNTTGSENTAIGTQALYYNTEGSFNTASGYYALLNNTASYNTATGGYALNSNTTGTNNVATGYGALSENETGSNNTASGSFALENNTASRNTASGALALLSNTTGFNNNAAGFESLYSNTTGYQNNAMGVQALYSNTTADNNNAMGYGALNKNTTGFGNSAVGSQALYDNTTGYLNDAIGYLALNHNTTGFSTVAIGVEAGFNQTTGHDNIYISHSGAAAEIGVTRIGTPGTQTSAYIAGIENSHVTGSAVYVTSGGQLGVLASSERYKTAIAPMGSNMAKLEQLRPVTFKLKTDAKGTLQYGLIAEEVAKVYPELVIRDQNGRIDGVRYDELAPILLNEVQKQQQTIAAQAAQLRDMQQQLTEIRAALLQQPNKDQLLARR